MSNRSLLTALLAKSDGIDEVAEQLELDENLIERGLNNYDSLNARDTAILDSAVSLYVNVTLEDEDGARAHEISTLADSIDKATLFIDDTLEDYFHTLLANEQITDEQLEAFGGMFPNLPQPLQETMLETIGNNQKDAQAWVDAYYEDKGDIYSDELHDSAWWEIMREFYDEQ